MKEMLTNALPIDLDLDELLSNGIGKFFIDGVNEAPVSAAEHDALVGDLAQFIQSAGECGVVVTTRFANELEALDLPVLMVDEISESYVREELSNAGLSPLYLNPTTFDLLRRPLFHRAWRDGSVALQAARTVHDIYSQLIQHLERGATQHFGLPIAFGDTFERIAYSMVDKGELSMSAAEVHANLRAALPASLDVSQFINYAISTGTLLATPAKRIAFFHHSVAEYFSARYLAKILGVDKGAVQHCLGRRDWDQAIFLTLGFLSEELADALFREILEADRIMALRAINYIEDQRSRWIGVALQSLVDNPPAFKDEMSIGFAMERLVGLPDDSVDALLTLVARGEALGGIAAGLVWRLSPEHRDWVLSLLPQAAYGFNFLNRLAEAIKDEIEPSDAFRVLENADQLDLDEETNNSILENVDDSDYVAVYSAIGTLLATVSSQVILEGAGAFQSPLSEVIICEALRNNRTPEALDFVQECIIRGHDHAIVTLYFQLEFGQPYDSQVPVPRPGLVEALASAIADGRQPDWALGALKLLSALVTEVRSTISRKHTDGKLFDALIAYARGETNAFFQIIERIIASDSELWQDPSIDAFAHVDIEWRGHEDLVLTLLRMRKESLATPLLQSLNRYSEGKWRVSCAIDDLPWWIDWLTNPETSGREAYLFVNRLGEFLGAGTDESTVEAILEHFETRNEDRQVLAQLVLNHIPALSIDMLSENAVEWLIGTLNSGSFRQWDSPLIGKIATEDIVEGRLLPLLLADPPERLRSNLMAALEEAGRRHGRRYIGENGQVLG